MSFDGNAQARKLDDAARSVEILKGGEVDWPIITSNGALSYGPQLITGENIALVGAPTNDIYFGTSVSQTLANLASYVTTLENAGFTVFVSTIIDRFPDTSFVGDPVELTSRWNQVNTGIRAQYPTARTLDFRADVPAAQDHTNATYYIEAPTGVHPTPTLQALMGTYTAEKVNAYEGW